jgi:hypothetical protein
MALDHEITWLERHPGSEYVIKEFVKRHEEEVEQAKFDRLSSHLRGAGQST